MGKVSVYLDDATIARLRRRAIRKHGTLRSLSRELEEIVRASFTEDALEDTFREMGFDVAKDVAFDEVRKVPVKPGASAAELIRESRERRIEGLVSRHQRRR